MASRLLALLLFALPAWSADVAGIKLDERTSVASTDLVLNGAGLRKRAIFQVYAMGLYLPHKTTDAAVAVMLPGTKRVVMHMLRDVSAEQFSDALADGIRANHSPAEATALLPRLMQLVGVMAEVKEAKKGMLIALDWTGVGTQVLIDGKPHGRPIPGEDFYQALLRIWLGEHAVQEDLKKALLGG